jgi:hypothetical protein
MGVKYGVWTIAAAGGVASIAAVLAWGVAAVMARSACVRDEAFLAAMTPVYERFEQLSVMLHEISEQQLISERAKEVAYRQKDLDALRRAIAEDILKRDWEAGLVLVEAMENQYGYKQEADRLRGEIVAKRGDVFRRAYADSLAALDRFAKQEQWQAAFKECERMQSLYGDYEQVRNLPTEVEARRQAFKNDLVQQFHAAANRRDIDGAIELLRKLDAYLTPAEGEALAEPARVVFREKQAQLRTQFALAVQEHNWREALRLGDRITADFPNTQMAKEVRDMYEVLKQRAASNSREPVAV